MKNSHIKAVFVDLDGTVYSHSTGSVPSSALDAVCILRQKGVLVFCATGRHPLELRDLGCDTLPFDGWLTLNGALCYDGGGIFLSFPMDRQDVETLIRESGHFMFPMILLEKDSMYINREDDQIRQEMDEIHTPMPEIREDFRLTQEEIYMTVPYCSDEVWDRISGQLKHAKWTRWSRALDVMSDQAGKGKAVEAALKRYGLKKEEVMGIGDGPNDRELLAACGISVCMGNGSEELMKEADYITDDIDRDGLRKAFAYFGMIQEDV